MSFPRYPEYKETGIEWLGQIPAHWEILRLKSASDLVTTKATERTFPIALENIEGWTGRELRSETEFEGEGIAFESDDILFGKLRPYLAKIYVATRDGEAVGDFHVFRPRRRFDGAVTSRFIQYQMLTRAFIDVVNGASFGARMPRASWETLGGMPLVFPSSEEQNCLIRFLDHETAKIDALVAEQEQLIALLKEKRQAVISHAVTKGLNPVAPMKDSGVEWIGEIPAHWKSAQIGRICSDVADGPHFSPQYVDAGVLFLSARNVKVDRWSLDDVKYVSEDDCVEFDKRVVPERGDILYTKGGTTGIARVVDLEERFQVWVHIAVLKVRKEVVDPHFVAYALNSRGCYEQSQLLTRGATNNDLGLTRMIKIWFGLPPLVEQRLIVARINREAADLDTLIAEAERGIELLQERRTALISAAVTGQIDVRGWADRSVA